MIGPSSGGKRKRFMPTWGISCLRTCLLVLTLLVVTAPVHAATRPIRALHFVVFNLSVDDAKRLIDNASKENFNTIILGMPWRNGLKLNSTPWVVPSKLTWAREDLLDVVKYARQKNLEIIPQLPLLSHQETLGLAQSFPDLMFNARTYDPRDDKVYQLVFPIIDELVDLINPKAIHIGHDEVVGWNKRHYKIGLLKQGEHMLPPDLFLADVNHLHAYLKKKNVETWMWGDMLIAPDEFPTMSGRPDINGSSPGYGPALRRKVPKDIVICDWHYRGEQMDFPTIDAFNIDGFRVLGTTWRAKETTRNFSRYAARQGANGMIASTWIILGAKGNKVVNNWDDIERLIRDSGEAFRENFPDAK